MEGLLPEYGELGTVRQPVGSRISTAAPSNAYPTSDGKWILIAANSEPLFARLAALIDRPDITSDPRFKGNQARVRHADALDPIIGAWSASLTAAEADRRLTQADIPCTQIYTAAECASDPQFRERGMVREIPDPQFGGRAILHPGIAPHVSESLGTVRWPGPPVGAHTEEVLGELLGLPSGEVGGPPKARGYLMKKGAGERDVPAVGTRWGGAGEAENMWLRRRRGPGF